MSLLFDPKVKLVAYTRSKTITIEGLYFDFNVVATIDSKPNSGKISVYNLSTDTRNLLSEEHLGIDFYAGYGDDTSIIFRGTTSNVLHERDGTEWRTDIYSGDGHKELTTIPFTKSYAAGTKIKTIVRDIAGTMGYSPNDSIVLDTDTLLQGASYSGLAKDVLDEVLSDYGYSWSIQWGALEILDAGGYLGTEVTAVVLRADTGMIGSPTLVDRTTKNKKIVGVKVTSMLNPSIKPGRLIKIEAQSTATQLGALDKKTAPKTDANGVWICKTVEYAGNNYGGDFKVVIDADQRA